MTPVRVKQLVNSVELSGMLFSDMTTILEL